MKYIFAFFFSLIINLNARCQELNPSETQALITFLITDYQEVPEEDASLSIEGLDTTLSFSGNTNESGIFKLLLPEGKKFHITVRKFGENFDFEKPLIIPNKIGSIRFEQRMKIRIVTEYVRSYTLENVYFDVNKYDIKKNSISSLLILYEALKKNDNMKVEIAGHTDDVGNDNFNRILSQKRADEVMHFIVNKGISKDRILAKGYGEFNPVASNLEESGKQKNRRTEVRIISE